MNHTKQFIEDAIKGGWYTGYFLKSWHKTGFILEMQTDDGSTTPTEIVLKIEQALLDPKFWQAIGKTRGWKSDEDVYYDGIAHEEKWHTFIDHLADGLSIEDALGKIV